MPLTEEEIERLQEHKERFGRTGAEYEQLDGFEVLEVYRDGIKYKFSYDGVEEGYRAQEGAKELFSEVLGRIAVEEEPLEFALANSDYSRRSRRRARSTLSKFTDENGYFPDEIEDDFSKLADEILE